MSEYQPKTTTPVSPKVTAAAAVALAAGVALAVLNALTTDSTLLGGLPPVVQVLILAAVPPVAVFLAGYTTVDPLRERGAKTPT